MKFQHTVELCWTLHWLLRNLYRIFSIWWMNSTLYSKANLGAAYAKWTAIRSRTWGPLDTLLIWDIQALNLIKSDLGIKYRIFGHVGRIYTVTTK